MWEYWWVREGRKDGFCVLRISFSFLGDVVCECGLEDKVQREAQSEGWRGRKPSAFHAHFKQDKVDDFTSSYNR